MEKIASASRGYFVVRLSLICLYMREIWRVNTTKLAQARPRPGLGSAQVYVVATLQGQIANVDANLDRAEESTRAIARNVRKKHDCLLVKKYWWKRKSQDLRFCYMFS